MLAPHFIQLLTSSRPAAIAKIQGDTVSPVRGLATFYNTSAGGVLVQVEFFHLPDQNTPGISGFFGMHIHDGDLPPLLSNRKYAWTAFYDTPFGISDIVGR